MVIVYLVIDFADRAGGFSGRAWGKAAAELYANKAAVVAYQLAPAALIIATSLLVTILSRRGELTALQSLGVRPARLAGPVGVFAALVGIGLFWLGESVVVRADARAEDIQVHRFNRWGDWATYHAGSSWLRGKQGRIYHLGEQREGGWEPATILEISPTFRLSRRIDARRIELFRPGVWRMLDAVETRYALVGGPGGTIDERKAAVLLESFPETPADLELRSGRPQQLPWRALREQIRRREAAGQQSREYRVALVERGAQPFQVVPAALASLGLATFVQKPRRRMPLAGAVALGMGVSMFLWAVSVIAHALAVAGTLAPVSAALIPMFVSAALAVGAFRKGTS